MTHGLRPAATVLAVVLTLSATAAGVRGQATTDAAAGFPRTAAGKPDLSGIWQVLNTAAWDLEDHSAQLGVPAGQRVVDGEIPYQPWAAAKKRQNWESRATADPENKCYLPGVPRITYMPFPFEIVQTPNYVLMKYEYAHAVRTVYTNGTRHPDGDLAFWLGDSRGRWDGDTLVVDVTNFTDQTWFDRAGNFHSEALHVIERYTPVTANHVTYEVTIEDSNVFTRPWKMMMPLYRRLDRGVQVLEYDCHIYLQEKRYNATK
jgi:hypothetical protein